MGIGFVSQAEMAFVARLVCCLLHRAQQHHLQQLLVGAVGDFFGQRGVIFRCGFVAAAQMQAEQAELFAQGGELFGRGPQVVAE